jgi:hypothetical protein
MNRALRFENTLSDSPRNDVPANLVRIGGALAKIGRAAPVTMMLVQPPSATGVVELTPLNRTRDGLGQNVLAR